jgi:hypothetical protein
MPAVRYPTRYRRLPHGPDAVRAFQRECAALLDQATELDLAQRALACELAEVRTQLAELRILMWPRIDPKDLVRGFRLTRRGGPPPIPPVAIGCLPLVGKDLRSAVLAILLRNDRAMTLVDIHREIHLNGYAIEARDPVQRLGNCLAYEVEIGRARRTARATYALGVLSPGTYRRIAGIPITRASRA